MPDRPSLEEALRVLGEAVADLSQRVNVLERAAGALPPAAIPAPLLSSTPRLSAAAGTDAVGVLSLLGRTLIVFGGAYLLRALTLSGRVPPGAGIALGLVYAVTWYGAADYAAGSRRRLSSVFHGTAAVVLGLPLIWEATTNFRFLTPETSALAVLVLTGLALAVAWHRRLPSLAAVASVAGILTSIALGSATYQFLPFAVALIAIGIATLWQADALKWAWLPWPAAIAADLLVVVLLVRSTLTPPVDPPGPVIVVCLALFMSYAASFAVLLLGRGRSAGTFVICQTTVMLVVALHGAILVARAHMPAVVWELGALGTAAGAAGYVAAFRHARRPGAARQNLYYFATVALALTLWGSAALEHGWPLALTLAVAAVTASGLASRFGEPMALLHGAIFNVGAAIASGLLSVCALTWLTPVPAWPAYTLSGWLALASAAAALALTSHTARAADAALDVAARMIFATLIVVGAGTALVLVSGPVLAGTPPAAGVLASIKTVAAACGAMLLARASRVPRVAVAGWLAYPLLLFGGLKLFLEDFRYSQPSTLFVALAVYGAALIAVPRLRRSSSPR
jgi:hypothetical protein